MAVIITVLTVPYNTDMVGAASDDFKIIRSDPSSFDWQGSDTAYIDFADANVPVNGVLSGNGLSLLTTESTGNTRASNITESGYLYLGYKARQNDNAADMELKPYVNGSVYLRLDTDMSFKSDRPYAIKVDYYGGGNYTVNSESYIDLCYSDGVSNNKKTRNKFGATYKTGNVETMYYTLQEADFSESIGGCKADFCLETWCGDSVNVGAQLKIRRISVIAYEPIIRQEMTEAEKPVSTGNPVYSIDFSTVLNIPLSGSVSGDGLSLVTSVYSGNTRASNIIDNGYLLLGSDARTNDNPADMEAKPTVTGSIYIKLDVLPEIKADVTYAVKVEYFGGGLKADRGSYIDLCYNTDANANKKVRNNYGDTYNSDKDETMYYLLSDSDFNEKINNESCGADFRLETWSQAQLKIKKISVVKFDSLLATEDKESLFVEEINGSSWLDMKNSEYYGLGFDNSAPIAKIVDLNGKRHYAMQSVDYLYFKVTDEIVRNASELTLSISYWDIGRNSFSVEYNAEMPNPLPDNTSESFYNYFSTASFEMFDTKELLTLDIPLENSDFRGSQTGTNDFRIRTLYISDFYIEKIVLKTGVQDISAIEPVAFPERTELNNFDSKTVVGYQAWFQASNSQTSGWKHWAAGSSAPESGKQTFDIYPDIADYSNDVLHQTGYSNFLNGNSAVLYDGVSEETIETQVKWMQDYDIDGFAVSRFFTATSQVEIKGQNKLDYMKKMAEKYGRIFYMGYDMSGIGGYGEAGIKRLEADFILNVEKKFVTSANYAQIDGKPVVSLWGFQGSLFDRYPSAENALSLIQWFHNRGYYVIGGCPDNDWAKDTTDYKTVYEAIDMITPWTVGRYNTNNAVKYLQTKYTQDKAWIDAYNIANPGNEKSYLPTIYPGFSWANWASSATPNAVPRNAGSFMWDQAKVTKEFGFTSSFIAMFDEFDEGTAVAKMAEDSMSIPSDQYFVTGAADGQWVSSDFYLRLTASVSKLLRGEILISDEVPIVYSEGPVYWRNSFEKRNLTFQYNGNSVTQLLNVDVCVNNGSVLESSNASVSENDVLETEQYAKTGSYVFALKGSSTSDGNTVYRYKIADTKIKLPENSVLTYTRYAANKAGENVFVDLLFDNGERLSNIQKNTTVPNNLSTNVSVPISSSLSGRTVTAVIISYESHSMDDFEAYIDDIVIENYDLKQGDVDENGYLESLDIICLRKTLLGVNNYSNTDVNYDGKKNIADLVSIKKL